MAVQTVTDPMLLDSTGQSILTALQGIQNAVQPTNVYLDLAVSIPSDGWSSSSPYVYTWTSAYVTPECGIDVHFGEGAESIPVDYLEYEKVSGGVKFTAPVKPTVNIPVTIRILNADAESITSVSATMVSTSAVSGQSNVEQALSNVDSRTTTNSQAITALNNFLPNNGSDGQLLKSNGDGTAEWSDAGTPTDDQVEAAIAEWMDEHPEATTNVEDGTISRAKLDADLKEKTDAVPDLESAVTQLNNNVIVESAGPDPIVSVTDGADGMPVHSLSIAINPVQDMHGYDNPWPGGGGKNLLNPTGTSGTDASVTYTKGTDGKWTSSGTASGTSVIIAGEFDVKAGVGYTLNGCPSGGGTATYRIDVRTAPSSIYNDWIDIGYGMTFTPSEDAHLYVYIRAASGTNMSGKTFSPMIRLSSVTDDTFAPYSNICPISGWTGANVTRTGKNLVDISRFATEYPDYCSFVNGVLSVTSYTLLYNTGISVDIPAGAILNWSVTNGTSTGARCRFAFEDGTATGIVSQIPYTAPKRITSIRFDWTSQGTFTVSDFQAEIGSSASAYEPYNPASTTLPISWQSSAGTVYGGTLTVNQDGTGTLVVDRTQKTFDGDEEWTTNDTNTSGKKRMVIFNESTDYKSNGVAISNIYAKKSEQGTYGCSVGFSIGTSFISVYDNNHNTTSDDFKTYITSNPLHIVYELATPVTYTLTVPQVKTLLGLNNVWADTGDIKSCTYTADTKLYIDKQIANLQAMVLENISNS